MNSPTEQLWEALADQFLDTETRHWLPRTAWLGVKSGLPWESISQCLHHQVAPAVAPNLLDIAGEWAGFPQDWLFSQIRACQGPTSVSRTVMADLANLWEALGRLFVYLGSASEDELPLLEGMAELALEKRWTRCHRLFDHLKLFMVRDWTEVCAAQRLVQEVYRPLLIHPGDPTPEESRRNWQWLEQYRDWVRASPDRMALGLCADLQYLFQEGDLSKHARILELRKGPADLRTCLEGPLALLFDDPGLGLRNWDRYVRL